MFKPTVSNLYYLMKDMTVKPSIFENVIYTERAFHRGYCFSTILNRHKDFVIAQQYSNQFRIVLTKYEIIKNKVIQTYASIPQFGETRVYKSGIRVTD